jgi:hypothetical protein
MPLWIASISGRLIIADSNSIAAIREIPVLQAAQSQPDSVSTSPVAEGPGWIPAVLIWLVLIGWSLLRVPVPGVNEPHYLGKAKHWWNPQWCAGDLFLDSSNPHLVFYATCGALTDVLSLPGAAVVGRCLALLILAIGWSSLARQILGRRYSGLSALPIFLLLQVLGNFSGEWVVGGVESKVVSYGLLFSALGSGLAGQLMRGAIACGLSVSFHPLVGLWGVIAGVLGCGLCRLASMMNWIENPAEGPNDVPLPRRSTLFLIVLLFILASLPGLVPAISMLGSGDPETERIATQLQVADRLAHHLDPMQLPKSAYRYYAGLLVIWLLFQRGHASTRKEQYWNWFVAGAILIAMGGIVIGWGPRPITNMPGYVWRMQLLKFYSFRLADLLIPMAVSFSVILAARDWKSRVPTGGAASRCCGWGLLIASLGALFVPFPDENPSRMSPLERKDWIAACAWLREHAPAGDLVYAADSGWAVKWFAQRPEYVNYKDVPQDAPSVVEWNRRLWQLAYWRTESTADGQVTSQELAGLRNETGIRWLIAGRFGPFSPEPAYGNAHFRVYALPAE